MDVLILSTASEFLWANRGIIKYILTCSYSAGIFPYLTLARKSLWPALEGRGPWSPWTAEEVLMAVFSKHSTFSTSHYPALPTLPNILCVKESHNCKVRLSNSKVLLLSAVELTKWYLRSAMGVRDQSNRLEIRQIYDTLREAENVGGQRFGS